MRHYNECHSQQLSEVGRSDTVMSLLSWLKKSQTTKQLEYEVPKVAGLPDANAEDNAVDGACLVVLKPK